MKLSRVYLFLLLLPLSVLGQRRLSFGLEMDGVMKSSEHISPFDAYQSYGPMVQLSQHSDSSKFLVNYQSGLSYVRSSSYSDVYSIPLNVGVDYQLSYSFFYGISSGIGTKYMFSGDAGDSRFMLTFRFGVYYDLFKGVPLRFGYERIGSSDAIFAQLLVYGFGLKKK